MRSALVFGAFVWVCACSPKTPPQPSDEPTPHEASSAETETETAAPEPDAESAASAEGEAASGGCKGPADCPGAYCQRPVIGDPQCTKSPDIMNAVILCKEDSDCKDLCVAFKGSPQCGKEQGTCNCDGK